MDRFPPLGAAAAGSTDTRAPRPSPPTDKEHSVPEQDSTHRPRRRPVLLAMLAAAALLLAVAGSGAFAGADSSSSSSGPSNLVQGGSAVQDSDRDGRHRDGRDCPKDRDRDGDAADAASPPV
jgi:hypothetical protein